MKKKEKQTNEYVAERTKKYLANVAIEVKDNSLWIKKDDSFIKIYCYNHRARHVIYYKNNPNSHFYDGLMLKEKLIEKYTQYTEENGTQICQ
jgi:hypothetical protein